MPSYSLRPAAASDAAALHRLAALDDAEQLHGSVLLAFSDDHVVAAMSLADGRVVADPFRRTTDAVALLRLWAGRQRRSRASRGALRFPGLRRLSTG
jgi:hypothetical protein